VAKMLFVNQLQNVTKVIFVLLTLGITTSSFPALADNKPITNPKPLYVPSGSINDLEGVQARNTSQWLGTGGESENAFVDSQTTYEPQMSAFVMRTVTVNRFWNRASTNMTEESGEVDPNLGDPRRSSFRVPFVQF
jgi:hypothetical protein